MIEYFSIHSHNYTLPALLTLPLYVVLVGGAKARKKALVLAGIIILMLAVFTWEYLAFAGLKATTFFNRKFLLSLPDLSCLWYWFCGAFLSPWYFLFWGHRQFFTWAIIFGCLALGASVLVIWRLGTPEERRLGGWALLLNALPFSLVSLGRYTFSYKYAFSARYVFFTLVGIMLLAGISWTIIGRRISPGWRRTLSYVCVGIIIVCQTLSIPSWQKIYLHLNQRSIACYQAPELIEKEGKFLTNPYYPFGRAQLENIRRFLKNNEHL